MHIAKLGVLIDKHQSAKRRSFGMNVFEAYIEEILAHAGIPYVLLDQVEKIVKESPDILIVAMAEESEAASQVILDYAEAGGHVISYGGLNYIAKRLGHAEAPCDSTGYAKLPAELFESAEPLRYLRARQWRRTEKQASLRAAVGALRNGGKSGKKSGAALLQFVCGEGTIERWSVDIATTVVLFQQGKGPILEDGIGAIDGTGAVNDGILKADDGLAVDWQIDRAVTDAGSSYFEQPYADLWREILIGHLLKKTISIGMTLPFTGYWPEGIEHIAHISHDSDLNIDESAMTTLQMLKDCGIHSTWCIIEPGYQPETNEAIRKAGHEFALHYNALEAQGGMWGVDEFQRQSYWLKQSAKLSHIHTNKNHYTRFEGWGELFEWCERAGIEADQTRGPSKKGNVGFPFGTCHPYFPISYFDEGNRLYNVLEVGFLSQDIDHPSFADYSVIDPFLTQVSRVGGVAHLLFHQVHIHGQPAVREALFRVVKEAKERGFVFWTCAQINEWERARRAIRITGINSGGEPLVEGKLDGAVVWIPVPAEASPKEPSYIRFGVKCYKKVLHSIEQLH